MENKCTEDRYMTSGIQNEIPEMLVLAMWGLLDKRKAELKDDMDYLQVFELTPMTKNGEMVQQIVMKQEVPEKKEVFYLSDLEKNISEKIFVISDGVACTMLKASEY